MAKELLQDNCLIINKDWGNRTLLGILDLFYDLHGGVDGLRGLDCGCGTGWNLVNLAKMRAKMSAIDISHEAMNLTKRRVMANEVVPETLAVATLAQLPYPDEYFDFLSGVAVFHHLDRQTLTDHSKELRRVLKDGGKAIFCEPLGHNPLLEFTRTHLPYPLKGAHTPPEKSLTYQDIQGLGTAFDKVKIRPLSFVQMVDRIIPNKSLSKFLGEFDKVTLRKWQFLEKFCRYVILEFF